MNRLENSASLYLRQHANNPVDWHPWDESALDRARDSGRPILLSIGYSACHWCHVMAHESFEDPETAAVMNRLFVNIKVDREERPDLDKVYQLSHQLLTGRGGGWPLTLFLDPKDLAPFFAGTYFPPSPRHGLPAFGDLLERVSDWFRDNRDAARAQNERLAQAISELQRTRQQDLPALPDVIDPVHEQLAARFDRHHGGFGGAPKFPQAPLLAMVSVLARSPGGESESSMLRQTLEVMALRGLRDPLDGGFYRYTVDGDWTIPHFEKMLYDNAQLLPLYAVMAATQENTQVDALFRQAAEGIAGWMLRDMRAPEGGLFASIDADAGGVEGGYHTWSRTEVSQLLGADYDRFADQFGLDGPPNFEGQHWHLVQAGRSDENFDASLRTLRKARAQRVAPGTDEKILTSWNALSIAGLARAGQALQHPDWISAAGEIMAVIQKSAWHDQRLYAVTVNGVHSHPAYLDDHAFLLDAGLALLQAAWDDDLYAFLLCLADTMLDQFEDQENGGFWFSASDQPVPMARLRSLQDDATPSGGAVAISALLRLAALSFESRYLDSAIRALECGHDDLLRQPLAHASLVTAMLDHLQAPPQVLVCGPNPALAEQWKAAISDIDRVNCYVVPPGAALPGLSAKEKSMDETTAHVCHGTSCLAAARSADELREQLQQSEGGLDNNDA
ncbi:MAG: thioredoxin domain-containing protein [Xanthomonadales bacterium]|nr:thioredoxin domain-containing protein [Xanthomonadales bacterium]